MSLTTGYYPVKSDLILAPTGYTSGGTSLGKVSSIHTLSVTPQFEFLTEHALGGIPVDARITALSVTYMIHLIDVSVNLLSLLFNKTNNSDKWQGFNDYKLGEILSSSQLSKLIVRPLNDNNTVDSTKPFLYIPRALCISSFNAIWDKRLSHSSGWVCQITALYDEGISSPILYGDVADFPTFA